MIDELHVRDVALIREATLCPSRGLTVITGETGAGKTALLSALKLLVGERADSSMVREGASSLLVEGRFFFDDAASEDASSQGLDAEDGQSEGIVVSRTLSVDGRSRVHINGAMAGVGQLSQIIGSTVDLCGQHEHQRLMKPTWHRAMLDAWAGDALADAQADYAKSYQAAEDVARRVEAIKAAARLGDDQVEQARFAIRRISQANPQDGEYETLCETVPKIENAESLMQAVGGAHEAIAGDVGALETISQAASLLESMAGLDETLGAAASSLRDASYVVEDVARDIRAYRDDIDYDSARLVEMQERLSDLQGLLRMWGPTMNEVFGTLNHAQQTVSAVEDSEEQMADALAAQARAEEQLAHAAEALHAARISAAPGFADAVSARFADLELQDAQMECKVEMRERDSWTQNGADSVEFMFRPGAGLGTRPLGKIASGGEISRVMLAIKAVLGEADEVETLVFDEVDAGVGGSAARALSDVLVDLAKTHQVVVVTHLPQVAVAADVHYVVRKTAGDVLETVLETAEGKERVEEIARMLSGDATKESLAHAKQMLKEAARSDA